LNHPPRAMRWTKPLYRLNWDDQPSLKNHLNFFSFDFEFKIKRFEIIKNSILAMCPLPPRILMGKMWGVLLDSTISQKIIKKKSLKNSIF
jgi:hypothetical protein